MAESDRSESQRRREDARRQRRDSQASSSEQPQADADFEPADESHAGLKHAAKVAAAGAAVGAAVGAALAARDGQSDEGEENGDEGSEPEARRDDVVAVEEPPTEEVDEQGKEPAAQAEPEAEAEQVVEDERESEPSREPRQQAPRRGASQDETVEVVRRAREQLQALQGHESESVSSLERTAEGWTVTLEVVELPRVPDSTDVMASYELLLDEEKNVIRFTRGRRYYRSQADRDGRG